MNGPVTALRIGLIGSGFIAKFHLQALVSVRHVTVTGVYSPTAANREALAAQANALELGPCRPFASLEAMLISGEVDAVWIAVPNFARLDTMREIHRLVKNSWAKLIGVACEKPLGRTLARSARDAAPCRRRQAVPRLSGKPGVLERRAARQGHRLAPRRAGLRPSLSGARRRGA
jgi:predicted dehydrogenase